MRKNIKVISGNHLTSKAKPNLNPNKNLHNQKYIKFSDQPTMILFPQQIQHNLSLMERQKIENTTFNTTFGKEPGIMSRGCLADSFSLSQDSFEREEQRKVFSRFLDDEEGLSWIKIYSQMVKLKQNPHLDIVKIGKSEDEVQQNRLISHYISIWIIQMGFYEPETKQKILDSLSYIFSNDHLDLSKVVQELYDKLFYGFLPAQLHLKVLVEICRKGWEYMTFFIARFIKILQSYKKSGSQIDFEFYFKVEAMIKIQ